MSEIQDSALEKELKEIISKIVEIEEDQVTLKAKFAEDLGMDSMMALEILASIEKKYKLNIPEEYLGKISSLSNLIELTKKFIQEKG